MSENWYALEQHVRERIADAQAVARSQSVARDFAARRRRPKSIGLIQRAGRVLASAVARILDRSRILTNPTEGHEVVLRGKRQ